MLLNTTVAKAIRRVGTLSLLVARSRPVLTVSAKVPCVFAGQLSVKRFCHGITSERVMMYRSRTVKEARGRAALNSTILREKETGQLDTRGFISISRCSVIIFSYLADNKTAAVLHREIRLCQHDPRLQEQCSTAGVLNITSREVLHSGGKSRYLRFGASVTVSSFCTYPAKRPFYRLFGTELGRG